MGKLMMRRIRSTPVVAAMLVMLTTHSGAAQAPVVVASKPFGESYLLAEMFAQLLEAQNMRVVRRPGLGSTEIVFGALRTGAVDVYPEYTGTGLLAVLHDTLPPEILADPRRVFAYVARISEERFGVRWLPPLGFQNTFALAVRAATASEYNLRTLSDLARESRHLKAGFTPDFISRSDGLAGLTKVYGSGVRPGQVQPLLPALKYQALVGGSVDVIDGFSTDGLLERYRLVVLEDDRHFFPPTGWLRCSAKKAAARSEVVAAITLLSGRIDEAMMRSLNRRVEVDGEDVRMVARSALGALGLVPASGGVNAPKAVAGGASNARNRDSFASYLWSRRSVLIELTLRHLQLVAIALAAAALVAVPWSSARARTPFSGRGDGSARNPADDPKHRPACVFGTGAGCRDGARADSTLVVCALPDRTGHLRRGARRGPRCSRSGRGPRDDARPAPAAGEASAGLRVIMGGVRTAAVITVGAATLAAFIGAGGLGEPIVEGLALADTRMVLSGALPAAALALLVDATLAVVERRVAPRIFAGDHGCAGGRRSESDAGHIRRGSE